jgi:predicted RNA-binding Zn-ribbon protein involved in translation (DUF1610 family)
MKTEPKLKLIYSHTPKCTSCNQALQKNKAVGEVCLNCFNARIARSEYMNSQ